MERPGGCRGDAEVGLETELLPEQEQVSGRKTCSTQRTTLARVLVFSLSIFFVLLLKDEVVKGFTRVEYLSFDVRVESASLNVLVVGDWGRYGLYNQTAVSEQMGVVGTEMDVDFIISVGDNFYKNGLTAVNDSAFTESFSKVYTAESLQKPWHVVLGNHDYRGDALAQVDPQLKLRDPRWHCQREFTLSHELLTSEGDATYVDFFFFDTTPFVDKYWNDTDHQYDWRGVEPRVEYLVQQQEFLSRGLESSNATWKIVVGHHPVRSVGYHGNTEELEDKIYPILQANTVDIYVNGHDHCLERITESGIEFLTSGGGSKAWRGMDSEADKSGLQFYYDGQGFLSLSISATHIDFSFYDALGNTLHEGELSKSSSQRV